MSTASPVRQRPPFDPEPHARELVAVLGEIAAAPAFDARSLDRILKRHPRAGRGLFSRSEIIAGFRRFAGPDYPLDEATFLARLRLRPVRTQSGVTPVTVLTRPHPCPGRCVFCPSDARMPKSYLSDEPGAQRAEANAFDPYRQTWGRLAAYRDIGHATDKVELIVLGGTWSSYPAAYQLWFVKRCLDAMTDFGDGRDGRDPGAVDSGRFARLPRAARGAYNDVVARDLGAPAAPEEADWEELEAAQRANEGAGARCVGLSLETRPDCVDEVHVRHLRRLGATKIQLGIQHTSDEILARNRRGHDVATTRRALHLLRGAGFKLQAHWMANLVGATPASDVADFARLFDDPEFRPDELKLYPTSLVESAELAEFWQRGEWRAYDPDELLGVVTGCLAATPPWCRLTRVIRDFSSHDIVTGNRTANLREVAERALVEAGRPCRDVRAREIRGRVVDAEDLVASELRYETSVGRECFLQFTTPDDDLAAFLRLSLPETPSCVDELRGRAVIRELHVYGESLGLSRRETGRAQHRGLGRALIGRAARLAGDAGYESLAVISAVGTRDYYRGLGFEDGALYQHLSLGGVSPS